MKCRVQKQRKRRENRFVRGVMTVEASFVMAAVLFACGAILTEGFRVHARTAGMMVLMDAAENVQNDGIEEAEYWANQALHTYYRCEKWSIELEKQGNRIKGSLDNDREGREGEVEMDVFEPERFLRLVRAFGV